MIIFNNKFMFNFASISSLKEKAKKTAGGLTKFAKDFAQDVPIPSLR